MLNTQPYPDGDPEIEVIDRVLNKVRGILSEHFEVGVIMLSRENEEGFTSYHGTQFGNKFAVSGMVEAYVNGEFDEPFIDGGFGEDKE